MLSANMFDRITQNYQPFMFVDNISNLCDIIRKGMGDMGSMEHMQSMGDMQT
jgi:hypothetical protein